jgi:hypothetical protein
MNLLKRMVRACPWLPTEIYALLVGDMVSRWVFTKHLVVGKLSLK